MARTEKDSWAKGQKIKKEKESDKAKTHGHIPGIAVGTSFKSRIECAQARVHAPLRAGIYGTAKDGAYSIVMSYGYEDDEDDGDTFIYSGEGGRESTSNTSEDRIKEMQGKKASSWDAGPRTSKQEWKRGNNALLVSSRTKKPVRVIRGQSRKFFAKHAPEEGYRYDGLYQVEKAWESMGKSGFPTCRFLFIRLPNQPPLPASKHQLLWKLSLGKNQPHESSVPSLSSSASSKSHFTGSSRESTPEPQSATSITRQLDSILEFSDNSEDENKPAYCASAGKITHATAALYAARTAAPPVAGPSQTAGAVQITRSQNNSTSSGSQASTSQTQSWAEIQALMFPKNTAFKDLKFKKNKH